MFKKNRLKFLFISLILTSCVTVSEGTTPTEAPLLFVTSTLPPTRQGLTLPTPVPSTSTPDSLTPNAASSSVPCRDGAVFVEDVTFPDNTNVNQGEKFTKTWKLQNTGTCTWTGYTVAFVSGDRMDSPDSVPVPETAAKGIAEVSVDLIAPTTDGGYTGNFELRNAEGEVITIGIEKTFWVKIVVGSTVTQFGTTNCNYSTNPEYIQQLIDLINKARADVGRGTLTVSPQLTLAAQGHSLDMACNDFLEHSGSDGTWIGDRMLQAGYTSTYYLEIIAIGLPQDAINQWRIEPTHWDAVINSRVTEIGVGYVFVRTSSYGGYWTVNMGRP
ncbi:MAG TPA: NBR1-Ig-like domain-containing protein [Anaerolineales bacterium]|nr:NBR1-Ig-like domain-containing protein [Anaerolineales bacterium]